MPLTGQPTFEARDVPTVTQMNAWMTTITAKFAAAITTGDLEWPMRAGGHINMDGNDITGMPFMAGTYNLGDRRPWETPNMVFAEVEARGGGSVVLPGNTTQTVQTQQGTTGIRIGSNTKFFGHGTSSVCGTLYAKGKSHIIVRDLQLNGNNQFIDCEDLLFLRCNFTATSGTYQLALQNCKRVWLVDCKFDGATTYNLYVSGLEELTIHGCYFADWGEVSVFVLSVDSGNLHGFRLNYNSFRHPAAYGGSLNAAVLFGDADTKLDIQGWQLGLKGNIFESDCPSMIRVEGVKDIAIRYNLFLSTANATTKIWIKRGYDCRVVGNIIPNGSNASIRLGGTTETEYCLASEIIGNFSIASQESLIVRAPRWSAGFGMPQHRPPDIGHILVMGNYFQCSDATLPAAALWDLAADDSWIAAHQVWWGNNFNEEGGAEGFHCYTTNSAVTQGGTIGGTSNNSLRIWFLFAANTTPGTLVSGAASDDMVDDASSEVTVQNNNT